jgi:hypothetical protein
MSLSTKKFSKGKKKVSLVEATKERCFKTVDKMEKGVNNLKEAVLDMEFAITDLIDAMRIEAEEKENN